MANVTPAGLQLMFQGLKVNFQAGVAAAQTTYKTFCMEVPSDTREEHYGWMDKLQLPREWLGPRVLQDAVAQEYTLKNRKWELSDKLSRTDVEDQRVGIYTYNAQMMGDGMAIHPDVLAAQVVEAGTSTLTFDNANFFSASHPVDVYNGALGTQSNYFTAATSGAMPLTAANVGIGRASMRTFKGRDNQPFSVNPTHIMGPPNMEQSINQICKAEMIAPSSAFGINASGGFQTNVLQNTLTPIINERLTSTTAWYLLALNKPVKPFVFQNREPVSFTYMINPNDPNVWTLDQFEYGAKARYNVGFGLWFFAAKFDTV